MLPWTPFSLPYLIEFFIARTKAALYYTTIELDKNVTYREKRTDREQRKDRETNYRGYSITQLTVGWSGLTRIQIFKYILVVM